MVKVNLYDFGDLLSCAVKVGYGWDEAYDILVSDGVSSMYETSNRTFYKSECTPENNAHYHNYSSDTIKILQAFFEEENVNEFTMVQ